WREFHSASLMVGAVLWLVLVVATIVLIGFYIKEKIANRRLVGASNGNKAHLKIHSAFYGIGNAKDVDITNTLQNAPRNALWLWVDNGLIPNIPDPAHNLPKRLKVEYSFGTDPARREVTRQEHAALVLPVDTGFIERTAAEY